MTMCCGIFGITDGTSYRRQNLPPMATFSQKQPRLAGFTQVSRGGAGVVWRLSGSSSVFKRSAILRDDSAGCGL